MKKKIAGVLTTVLAASLLVGGNSSVTVEKDNMVAQSQNSEETQSDEAEEEDTQSEEAEEVAKVAADPEDQPAATETPEEEKKAEKETQKREESEDSSTSTSSDEKTLLKKAQKLAQQYDYTGAISVLQNNWKFATSDKMQKAVSEYRKKRDACVEYPLENITHVFFHSLIVDTSRAFDGDSDEAGYNQMMTTVSEFKKMIQSMYEKGYVLVSPHDMAVVNDDGTMSRGKIMLPEGKIPFVLSEDDVSYYHYMDDDGFATKLVIDDNGDIKCEYKKADGTVVTGDYDVVPILDSFIKQHPDFSYHGRKGILAMTGYNGVLGYRTDGAYKTKKNLQDNQKAFLKANPDFDYDKEVKQAKKVAKAMKKDGWEFSRPSFFMGRRDTAAGERASHPAKGQDKKRRRKGFLTAFLRKACATGYGVFSLWVMTLYFSRRSSMASSSKREAGIRVFSESSRNASHSSGSTVDAICFLLRLTWPIVYPSFP